MYTINIKCLIINYNYFAMSHYPPGYYLPKDITYTEMSKKVAILQIMRLTKKIYKKYPEIFLAKELIAIANSMRHLTNPDTKIPDEDDRYIRIHLFRLNIKYHKLKCELGDKNEDYEYYAFSLLEHEIDKYFVNYVK